MKNISASPSNQSSLQDSSTIKVLNLIKNFQTFGYLSADVDPLKLMQRELNPNILKESHNLEKLNYKNYGFTDADLEKEFNISTNHVKV